MASPTHLHETFCTISREPPNQGDVLEGLAILASTGAVTITDVVKEMHREIVLRPVGLNNSRGKSLWSKGMTNFVYHYIQTVMKMSGRGAAAGMRVFNSLSQRQSKRPLSPMLHRVVSAMNGVMGDHLINQQNPLALPMMFYNCHGVPERGEIRGNVVILTHGLCMDQHSWCIESPKGLGSQIRQHFPNTTVLYTSYNTGRRISQNGFNLSELIQLLCDRNPHINDIHLIGHSMGGLVSRSALFYAKQDGHPWHKKVYSLICLGSPHNGAILERLGYLLLETAEKIPFAGALAKLGDIRSAGIIDLRHGSVRNDDWEHLADRVGQFDDNRKPAPLPTSVNTFLIAGTMQKDAERVSKIHDAVGDILVSVDSALGVHPNPSLQLKLPDDHKNIFYGVNHMALQYDVDVIACVVECLAKPKPQGQVRVTTELLA